MQTISSIVISSSAISDSQISADRLVLWADKKILFVHVRENEKEAKTLC